MRPTLPLPRENGHHRPVAIALLVALSAIVLLTGLGERCLERERETRIALTARTMAEGGSWLIPEYRGELRLKKPPLPYWMVAALYKMGAPVDSAFWARLTTAVLAIGLVLATYFVGATMIGPRAAYLGALAMIGMQPFLIQGRVAEADVGMMLFLVLSVGAIYLATHPRGNGKWWLLAGVAAGLGFMMKGVAAVMIPTGTAILFGLMSKNAALRIRWRWAIAGLLSCLLIAAPWYLYIYAVTTGEGAASEAIANQLDETFGEVGRHPEPFWYYLEMWPGMMALWGWLAPLSAWALWRARKHRGSGFLFAWFIVGLVLLSAITTKQRHYALILVPAVALSVGYLLARLRLRHGFPSVRAMDLLTIAIAVGAAIWLGSWQPATEDEGVIPEFMDHAELQAADRGELWTTGKTPWCTEFYFDRPVRRMSSVTRAWERVPSGGSLVVIQRGKPLPGLDEIDAKPVLDRARGHVRCLLFFKP